MPRAGAARVLADGRTSGGRSSEPSLPGLTTEADYIRTGKLTGK